MRHERSHLLLAALAAVATACGGSGGGTAKMSVHLVDGPTPEFSAVNIDVKSVEIHGDAGWVTLGAPDKVVNLLALTGGVVETLANGATLQPGHYDQLRLVLGTNNTVVLASDQSSHDLKVPSGSQSGLKLNVHFDVAAGETRDVYIDFDAHRSVFLHETGDGKYLLRPVIFCVDRGGSDSPGVGTISGLLIDDGEPALPLPGVTVTAQVLAADGTPSIARTVTTGVDGRYVLDLLPLGATYHVVAQPVVSAVETLVVFDARASAGIALTTAAPTATQDLAFLATVDVGTLSGGIAPPLGANEADVVSLRRQLDAGGTPGTFIVRVGPGALSGTTETYYLDHLPVADYQAVVTRQGEDAAGLPTFTSSAPVALSLQVGPNTLDLVAP